MIQVDVMQAAQGEVPVWKIEHGEKVREPGVYEMPMGWYHDHCCIGPSISSSGLRRINAYSPLHYWQTSPLNPNRDEDAEDDISNKEAVRLGRAVHTLVLEPERFRGNFVTRPAQWENWRTNDSKAWRADQQRRGATVMDGEEMVRVAAMAQALREHPISLGMLDGDIERALLWMDRRTGVWLKARPDALPRGTNMLADLKCLRDVRDHALQTAVFKSGYDQQLALTGVGMAQLLGREVDEHVLVCVENKRPCAVVNRPIAPNDVGRALILLRRSINRFAECVQTDEWPGIDDDNTHLSRPEWETKRMEQQIKLGTLPQEF